MLVCGLLWCVCSTCPYVFACLRLSPSLWQVSSPLVPKQTIRRRSAVCAKSSSPPSGGGFQSDMKDSWRERENRHKEPLKMSGPGASTRLNGSSEASWRPAMNRKIHVTVTCAFTSYIDVMSCFKSVLYFDLELTESPTEFRSISLRWP